VQLRELDAKVRWPAFQVVPREGAGGLGLELGAQRHGIVVVQQDEVIADWKFAPGLQDEAVLEEQGMVRTSITLSAPRTEGICVFMIGLVTGSRWRVTGDWAAGDAGLA